MLLLTKAVFAIMIGFLSSVVLGLILIPVLKKMHIGQKISVFVGETHRKKEDGNSVLFFILLLPGSRPLYPQPDMRNSPTHNP